MHKKATGNTVVSGLGNIVRGQFLGWNVKGDNRGTHLEEIGISEGGGETEDIVAFGMFWHRLHDGAVHNDEMFRSGLYRSAFSGITRIEEKSGALEANPVAFPSSLAS